MRTHEEEQRRTEGLDIGDEGFKEIQRRKKPSKEGMRIQQKEKSVVIENQNKFQVLQEEEDENEGERKEHEDNENVPMEIIRDTKEKSINQNREVEEETGESQGIQ